MNNENSSDKINNELAYKIAKNLRDKGYEIANSIGVRLNEPKHNVIGILKPRDSIQKKLLGLKFSKKQKALYLGNLWLENEVRGVNNENWVLEVYGKIYFDELTELAKKLSESLESNVQFILIDEQPRIEYE